MNEILVARNAFAETLTSSAVCRSVTRNGTPVVEQRRVELADRGLRARRIPLHAKHQAVGVQGVLDGEALAQELGVPRHLDVDAVGRECPCSSGQSAAVPTGTVDLPTITAGRASAGAPASSITAST